MESSRRRNSILDWLIAATLAAAAISATAGIDVDLGPVALRSHGAGSRVGRRCPRDRHPLAHRNKLDAALAHSHRPADGDLRQRRDVVSIPGVDDRRRRFLRVRQRQRVDCTRIAHQRGTDRRLVVRCQSRGDCVSSRLGASAGWGRDCPDLPARIAGD